MLHPDARALLDLIEERGLPAMHTLSPVEARAFYRDRRAFTQPADARGRCRARRALRGAARPDPACASTGRALPAPSRRAAPPLPVLVYYHGGGWTIGDLDTHDVLCRAALQRLGRGRRLGRLPDGPRAPLPGRRRRLPRGDALGPPRTRASSASTRRGSRSAATAPAAISLPSSPSLARDGGDLPIAYQLLIYPATDMRRRHASHTTNGRGYLLTTETISYYHDHYIADPAHDLDWRASPLLHADLTRLPPALVLTAGFDPLRDEGLDVRRPPRRRRQPRDLRLLRAADPRLHHHGQGDRRGQLGGRAVRRRAGARARGADVGAAPDEKPQRPKAAAAFAGRCGSARRRGRLDRLLGLLRALLHRVPGLAPLRRRHDRRPGPPRRRHGRPCGRSRATA